MVTQFKVTRDCLWSWNLNSWERGSGLIGSLSWVSTSAPRVLGISLVTRGQFSTRSAWTWAGTQTVIYSSVSGIISKELPKEITDIFHFVFNNRYNNILSSERNDGYFEAICNRVKKSYQKIIFKGFEVDYSRGKAFIQRKN